ncbi:MAG TPA: DUF1080 domain-containing protein [Acidobacteriota bacterium]|nr:DUF1080 domain-containing protein [Acidobacteriota bacterium]
MSRGCMLLAVVCMLGLTLISAEPVQNTLSQEELAQGWILLWDGETSFGWEPHISGEWKGFDGTLHASPGCYMWLRNTTPFANFVLKADVRMKAFETDSGIFIRAAKEGDPTRTGYQININNLNKDYGNGSIVNRVKSSAGTLNAKEWHSYEITAEGDHITVAIDGRQVLDARDNTVAAGYIGLQYLKGDDVEFRNIKLRPLGLQPIFDGIDLSGWQRVDRPDVKAPPEWSVKDNAIHVEKGPGGLETTGTWADFVLQLEARANAASEAQHPNSGVFFRGDEGQFWSGYESQIRNEFKDGDPAKAVDYGTGGLYNRQPARRVVSRDNEYFFNTIIACGRHVGIWINGIQVTSFDDPREEGMNARQQARLAAGTISLQAHDPTTNLDFRHIRIAEIPKR